MRAKQLVGRDMALACLVGALGTGSSDFGASGSSDFGDEFGDDFGDDDFGDDDFGDDDFGDDFAGDFAGDFGAAKQKKRRAAAGAGGARALQAWNQMKRKTQQRGSILNPNKGSHIDVERYSFTVSEAIVLGTALTFTALSGTPDTRFRPQRVTCNAPTPMFAYLSSIKASNVNATVGTGQEDAYNYNPNAVGSTLDLPTLEPSNRVTVLGNYTGFTPPGFVNGSDQFFSVNFKGPSTIVGG
jgi:hypothetical protein